MNLDQRQTIVDVICAYLRMPYSPPADQPPAEDAPAEAHTRYEQRRQELQVRLTAQRILGAHLRPKARETFWTGIDLDLTGAHLHQLDLTNCHIRNARFGGAQFDGDDTGFDEVQFGGDASFGGAQFGGDAVFSGARFGGATVFGGDEVFSEARFGANASFCGARARSGLHHSWPAAWTTHKERTVEGETEGWMYLVRVNDSAE